MNIVSMALTTLSPMIVDKIAGSLGISSPLVRKAMMAIVPTILGSLMGSTSKPGGLDALGKVLEGVDTGILGKLGEMIGGAGQQALVNSGSDMLGGLLGKESVGALGGAVSKFAGVDASASSGLLGLLAPVVMGTLAQQKTEQGLDVSGVAKLLESQKDNIAAAMPPGFSDLLKGTGLLSALPSMPKPEAAATPPPVASHPQREAAAPRSGGSKIPLVAGLLLAALAAWYVLGRNVRVPGLPAAPQISAGTQNIGAQIGTLAEGLRGTLPGMTDAASARSALPRLTEMGKQLESIETLRGQLPAAGKQGLAAYVASLLPILRPMIDAALARAGVGPVVKPVLDQILNRLETMAKA
ncbi:MAG: DUF937 domain-containing protein [Hyphomicrobiaceae bacterium]